jgi:hypothetical protein
MHTDADANYVIIDESLLQRAKALTGIHERPRWFGQALKHWSRVRRPSGWLR